MDKFLLLNSPDLMIMSTNLVRNPELSPCSIGLYARMIAGSKKSYTRDYLLWFCNDDENVLNISKMIIIRYNLHGSESLKIA